MANETLYTGVNNFIPDIWEGALFYLRKNFVMPTLVRQFSARGFTPRDVTEYAENSVDSNLLELEDLTPTLMVRNLLSRLVPKEIGVQYLVTDRRVESDLEDVLSDAAIKVGYEMGKQVETDLVNLFSSLTGGVVGTANNPLTWDIIYQGRSRLAHAGVPAPYNVVLQEWQWHDLAVAQNNAATSIAHSMKIRDDIQSDYYVGSTSGMNFFISNLITKDANDDAYGAIFNPNAIALDMRRGLRIEGQRDASLRASELNATMVYAAGLWRPTWGVRIFSDVTAAGSDITQNSALVISGFVDDATTTVGQVSYLDFIVTNNGSIVSTGIEVTITVPTGVDTLPTGYADLTSASQGSYSYTTKKWAVGSLAAGQSARLRVVYQSDTSGANNFVGQVTSATPATSGTPTTGNILVTVA